MISSALHTSVSNAADIGGVQPPVRRNRKSGRCFAFLLLLGIGILNGVPAFVGAQDLHFSQFFNSPLTTNPANTGFLPENDYRLGANYRQQWASMPAQFKTMSIFGDAQVFRDRFESGWVGVGGVILRDVAGSGNLTSTKVYGSAAYHQMLGSTGLLSLGFNLGWANKRVDVTKFTFDNQWNGKFFDAGAPSGENFAATNINYLDVQVGLNYAYFPTDNIYLHAGVSVHHVNAPKESFFNSASGYNNAIARRYIAFADAVLKVNDRVIVSPGAYFTTQAKAKELTLGLHANYNLSGDGEKQVIGGLYYRGSDAVIPMIGFQWKSVRLMFSYDATTSSLKNYNNMQGASEFALLYNGYYNQYNQSLRQMQCPVPRF
ncbi:PorP/SprF family type IX secretion system membrane protein [Agriterribacter sp.]|uniref:PorP/SprF family type IX secretion system membrane protein n=1 Tax=Agriterribacter sp. TaxID=2821509 RepID=UPI002D7ED9CE|nr:PorP/SprF family type IX secretion system membrane protein [Agriterribacter sp.]